MHDRPGTGVFAARYAHQEVLNTTGATAAQWPYFFQPNSVLFGPPCGDDSSGQFDGISLGYDSVTPNRLGGKVIVGFGDAGGPRCIIDDGSSAPDFAVYGNGFLLAPGQVYNKIATVEVATAIADGNNPDTSATWYLFPPSYSPSTCYASFPADVNPSCYVNFAGVEPTSAGGDQFDLGGLITFYGLPHTI